MNTLLYYILWVITALLAYITEYRPTAHTDALRSMVNICWIVSETQSVELQIFFCKYESPWTQMLQLWHCSEAVSSHDQKEYVGNTITALFLATSKSSMLEKFN